MTSAGEIVKELNTGTAIIRLRKDGLIHVHYKKNFTLDTETQVTMRSTFIELSNGIPRGFIFSADEGFTMTKEARENFRSMRQGNPIKAYAIVIASLPQRLVANFFFKMYQPSVPAKLFKNAEEGAKWLLSIK